MNQEEYRVKKLEITSLLGAAEYDWDRTPLNEAAKQQTALKAKYLADCRFTKRQEAKEKGQRQSPDSLQGLELSIPEEKKKEYKKIPLPEITLAENDLKQFGAMDREILIAHFANLDLNHKQLANSFNRSYQYVAGLLRSKPVQLLETKYFYEYLNIEAKKSLLRAVKAGDSRILEGASEFLKIMTTQNDGSNGSKPMELTETERAALKELGDRLADVADVSDGKDSKKERGIKY